MAGAMEQAKQAFIQRDFEAAVERYEAALQELPEDQLFVAWSNKGAALMNTGQVKEAVRCFRRALELNPEHYESMHNMGVAFAAMRQFDKALECFEKTIQFAPYFYASHCGKSEALASLNRFDEAADAAKDAIKEDPNEPIAHADLGFAFLKMGRFEEAVKSFERAHQLKDRSPETVRLHALALSELGMRYQKGSDLTRALDLYLRSVQKHETPLALHNLGVVYVRQKQLSKARSAFGKALRLDKDFFPSNAALGVLHARENRYDLAIPYLLKAYEAKPNDVENLHNLGLVYMKDHNREEALRAFKNLIRIDPANADGDAKVAIQLLRGASSLTPAASSSSHAGPSQPARTRRSGSNISSSRTRPRSRDVNHRNGHITNSAAPSPRFPAPVPSSASSSSSTRRRSASVKKRNVNKTIRKKKLYTLEELQAKPPPAGIDTSQKEMYLLDQEFIEVFGMPKEEFINLPSWKQTLEKKKYNLF